MAVMNGQYKHPQSAYSQGFKELINAMLTVDPAKRPDIHQVSNLYAFLSLSLSRRQRVTDRVGCG